MKWAATMPKEKPTDPGVAQVVFARRSSDGARAEFIGKLTRADADRVMRLIIDLSKNVKKEA